MNSGAHIKKYFLIALVVSLTISAIIGIFVFLLGNFGELEMRILLTTLSIVLFSLAALCDSALYDKGRFKAFAVVGIVIGAIAFFYSLGLIWEVFELDSEWVWKTFITFIVISVMIAHISLMFLIDNRNTLVRISLWATILFTSTVALMILLGIYEVVEFEEFYFRLFGVFVILDALGTLVTPILNKVVKSHEGAVMPSPKVG
jgi:hypothetical protein